MNLPENDFIQIRKIEVTRTEKKDQVKVSLWSAPATIYPLKTKIVDFGTRFDFSVFPILFVMKKIFLLFFSLSATLGMAQHFDYASHWKEIEQQEKEQGKLKSLLPEVDAIYEQAKKDNEIQQRIKALLYQSKIALATTD